MIRYEHWLTLRFEGDCIGPGRIPMAQLLLFLESMNKAFLRTGRILSGEGESLRRGSPRRCLKDEVSLDLVQLTHGSPAAVLGFERRAQQGSFSGLDLGAAILECSISGLTETQGASDALPLGWDSGVLMAWRDAGSLFGQGVSRVQLVLNHGAEPLSAFFTPDGCARISQRIRGPNTNLRSLEGRLLMVDFKERGLRCRIHPSFGDPVPCLFEESQKDEVLEDLLAYVRVIGEAQEDPQTGKITSITIRDIERIEEKENQAIDLLPEGLPVSQSFWESPDLDELATAQGVAPVADARSLFGTWPGEIDDGFEEAIEQLRRVDAAGGTSR